MFIFVFSFLMLLMFVRGALACTTVILGKNASATGHVVVGHNEDDADHIVNRHGYVPPSAHACDEVLSAETGCACIPQVPQTHGFYWSEVKRASGGLSNADSFYNDAGVLIVSDSCGQSKMDMDDPALLSEGGIGYNLRRIMAERAKSAREAIEIAADMLSRYGYTGSGRAYVAADADEAWVLQASRGKHYVARRVGDNEAVFIPNWFTVHDIDDSICIISPGLIEYAREKGWYDPKDGPFDFSRVWQSEKTWMGPGNRFRSAAGYSLLTRSSLSREDSYPFAIVPREPIPVDVIKEVLRSHFEGTVMDPEWMRSSSTGGSPHNTELRRICTGTTVESIVAVFSSRDRPDLTTLWTCFGRPCELPYLPLHPFYRIPRQFDSMGDQSLYLLNSHIQPEKNLSGRQDNIWQEFRDYQNLFELFYEELHTTHERALLCLEQVLASHEEINITRAFDSAADSASILYEADEKTAALAVSRLRGWTKELAKLEMKVTAQMSEAELILTFSLDAGRIPQEAILCLSWENANARTEGIHAITDSLHTCNDKWTVRFPMIAVSKVGSGGTFDFYLGGRDQNGKCFGGHFSLVL